VILGKLVANSLRYVIGLVALFPVLMGPLLLGGVGLEQCARLFISIGNMMLFSAAAGMLGSTVSVREQAGQAKALQIMLLFTGGLPLLAKILRYYGWDSSLCLWMDLVSPLYAQRSALGGLVGPQVGWFIFSATIVFLMSCSMLAAASWLVPRMWQEGGKQSLAEVIGEKLRGTIRRTIPARSEEGKRMLDGNPFEWLVMRDQSLRRAMWILLGGTVGLVVLLHPILSAYWSPAAFPLFICVQLVFVLVAIVKVRAARLAVRHIAGAKENGVLEVIVGSRVSLEEMVRAQFRALWNLLGGPQLALVPLLLAALAYTLPGIDRLADTFTTPPETAAFRVRAMFILVVALVFVFLDSITLTWVGMMCAFKASRAVKAHSWTGFLVLALPNTVYLALVVALVQFSTMRPMLEAFLPPVLIWIGIKLATNLVLYFYSRAWLLSAARESVTAPLEQIREKGFFPKGTEVRQFFRNNLKLLGRSGRAYNLSRIDRAR
jgi:hypothetical protein